MLKKCEFFTTYFNDLREFFDDMESNRYEKDTYPIVFEWFKDKFKNENKDEDFKCFLRYIHSKPVFKVWERYFQKEGEEIKSIIEDILKRLSYTYTVCEIGDNNVFVIKL